MAELDTFNILTRSGLKLPVTGVIGNPTITPRWVDSKGVIEFGLGANEVNGGMGGIFASGVVDSGTPANSFVLDADAYYNAVPLANSVLAKHDKYTQTMGRHDARLLSFMEWWDSETPGFEHALTFDGASGDAFITVSHIGLLTVGQAIASSGASPIPADTKIVGIHASTSVAGVKPTFTVFLSKALVALAADSVATLTGAILRARIPVDDYMWHGSGLPSSVA